MLNLSGRHLCSHRVTSRTYQIDSHTPAFFTPSGDRGRRQASLAMATHPAAYPLLPSAPLPSRHLVDNPNLPGWLEECREVSLVLALAPAGFGKTTAMLAIHEHLGNDGFATAWIQLSAEDNHFERFCTVVLEACGQRLPDTGTNTHVPNLMDARYTGSKLGQMLLESLAALRAPTALFLDDFHHITDARIVELVQRMIERLPTNSKLFITSRSQPALRLYKLKAQGRLLQIGMQELSFDYDQAEAFLNQRHQLQLEQASVRRLLSATEGWPAGLQLAALALKTRHDRAGFIENFCEQTSDIGRYLYEEVFWDQDEAIKSFLLQTSVLKTLNPALCQAVTLHDDAATMLRQLELQGLFLARLGDSGNEYRYHQLFAEFLLHKLKEEQPQLLPMLHERAALWFLAARDAPRAIEHAIAARNFLQACEILRGHVWYMLSHGHVSTCRQWLGEIPQEVLAEYPALLVALCWTYILQYEYSLAAELTERLRNEPQVQNQHEYSVLEPLTLALMDRVADCEAARQRRQDMALSGLSQPTLGCVQAYVDLCSQRFDLALDNAKKAGLMFRRLGSDYGTTFSHGVIAYALLAQGRALEAVDLLEPMFHSFAKETGRHHVSTSNLGAYLAAALYELGDFARAESLAREYLPQARDMVIMDAVVIVHRILARSHLRAGRHAEAAAVLHAGTELARSLGLLRIVAPLRLEQQYQAVYQFDQGQLQSSARLALQPEVWDYPHDRLVPINDIEDQALARLRLQLREGRAAEAMPQLNQNIAEAWRLGRIRRWHKLCILRAQALQLLDRGFDARQALADLLLSHGELQLLASFWDEGPQVRELLSGLQERLHEHVARAQVERLNQHLNQLLGTPDAKGAPSAPPAMSEPPAAPSAAAGPPSVLSAREMQVLHCLAAGMPNKQIADSLHISEPTVKFHLRNLNLKLDAKNRTHAVFIAREQGWVK